MELQEINITEAKPLLFEKSSVNAEVIDCEYVTGGSMHVTQVHVTVQGDRSCGKSFVTFHDIGMNHVSSFSTLFNTEFMEPIKHNFCLYHIDAPGMQDNAVDLAGSGFVYPSMENLADMIPKIFTKLGIKRAICMGAGVGANVFMRFALKNPNLVDGFIAINATIDSVSNFSWIGEKLTNWATPLHEQLLNYHFSKEEVEKANFDLVEAHRKHFKSNMNAHNVAMFLREYERRSEINLIRPIVPGEDKHTLTCNTLLMVGDLSPFVDDVVEVNFRLNPRKSTFLKMADAGGMLMEEQTFKVAEAIIYFLQGLGYIPSVIMSRLARCRTLSASSTGSQDNEKKRQRTLSGGSTGADTDFSLMYAGEMIMEVKRVEVPMEISQAKTVENIV